MDDVNYFEETMSRFCYVALMKKDYGLLFSQYGKNEIPRRFRNITYLNSWRELSFIERLYLADEYENDKPILIDVNKNNVEDVFEVREYNDEKE